MYELIYKDWLVELVGDDLQDRLGFKDGPRDFAKRYLEQVLYPMLQRVGKGVLTRLASLADKADKDWDGRT